MSFVIFLATVAVLLYASGLKRTAYAFISVVVVLATWAFCFLLGLLIGLIFENPAALNSWTPPSNLVHSLFDASLGEIIIKLPLYVIVELLYWSIHVVFTTGLLSLMVTSLLFLGLTNALVMYLIDEHRTRRAAAKN